MIIRPTPTLVARAAVPAALVLAVVMAASARPADPETKYVTDADAEADAQRIESETTVTTAEGLSVSLWASEKLLGNSIAIHMDDGGRALITVNHRSNESELEIRDAPAHWRQETMKLTSVEGSEIRRHCESSVNTSRCCRPARSPRKSRST